MAAALEFVVEYVRKSANQRAQFSRSLWHLCNLALGNIQKAQIYKVIGSAGRSGDEVTTLFVGNRNALHQFAALVYNHINGISYLRELRFKQVAVALAGNKSEITAVRVEGPAANGYGKQGYLLLPNISFNLDLHIPFENIIHRMSRRRRRDIKKVESLDYTYTVCSKNDEDFDFFYWKMYLPYAQQRFGKAASIKRYSESKAFYRTGGRIIFVKKAGKPVAGILFRTFRKTLYAVSIGSCPQEEEQSERLAGQAALFFLIKWAHIKGLESLDYGVSLPFFNEGVFMYKKEWGMRVEEPLNQSYCALKLNTLNTGVLSFLQRNPFIIADDGRLKGLVLLDHQPTSEELNHIFSEYFLPSLSSIIFIAYYKSDSEFIGEAEPSTRSVNYAQLLSKPLSEFCLLLQKSAFKVEVTELKKPIEN